jgi:hypothetical protein
MKDIVILGGGIGGLTVAHELSKHDKFRINIYEKTDTIGGMARSSRDIDGCATEYCWRVFFGFYNNFFTILKEIPLIENSLKTPLDNLSVYKHKNFYDSTIPLSDKLNSIKAIVNGITSCDERLVKLDNLSWWDAIKTNKESDIFRQIGPWLGMDRYNGSFNSVIRVGIEMQILSTYLDNNYRDYVTTLPTSEAIFDHWQEYLMDKNVGINFNKQVSYIKVNKNKVEFVVINNEIISGDYYILNLPINALNSVINKNPQLKVGDLGNIQELCDTCLHMQLSFQVYFNKAINLNKANAFLIVDSSWDLIVLCYDQLYTSSNLCKNLCNIKGGWSIAVCTAYMPGILYKKPFRECTYEEIINEIWAQVMNCNNLKNEVKKYNNFDLSNDLIVKWSPMWDSFYYSNNKLYTTEPKFTNNKGSLKLRPSFKTSIDNMYISTAYIKETIDIYSMEAACIAGRLVAKDIINKERINNKLIVTIPPRPKLLYPFRLLDSIFYKLGLPNLTLYLLFITVLIIIVILIRK